MLNQDPLTDEEFDELDQFLLNVEGLDDSMDISMLDGTILARVARARSTSTVTAANNCFTDIVNGAAYATFPTWPHVRYRMSSSG